jgi:hypothetical protein
MTEVMAEADAALAERIMSEWPAPADAKIQVMRSGKWDPETPEECMQRIERTRRSGSEP